MDGEELSNLKMLAESIKIKLEADNQMFLFSPEALARLKFPALDKEGLPIGYKVFPDNMYEGHTLIPMLLELRKRRQLVGRATWGNNKREGVIK